MGKFIDLAGKRFGRLIVIERDENDKYGNLMWLCKCDCGNVVTVRGNHLKHGQTQSCGCLQAEKSKERIIEYNYVHGKRGTRIYGSWKSIKDRCLNCNSSAFHNYGGRGITICDEWKNDFQAFYDYVSQLPHFGEKGYTLDRINNDRNYEPGNVKWSTEKEQANNRRTNVLITFNNETHTLQQWSEITGINKNVLSDRMNKLHWSVEKALMTPVRKCIKRKEA